MASHLTLKWTLQGLQARRGIFHVAYSVPQIKLIFSVSGVERAEKRRDFLLASDGAQRVAVILFKVTWERWDSGCFGRLW